MKTKQIVAVVGDFYHDRDLYEQALLAAAEPLIDSQQINIDFIAATDISTWLQRAPDAFVLAVEDRIAPEENPELKWMSEEVADQIASYVERGGAWLGWHSGLASYDEENSYVRMLRGHFISHPDENKTVRYEAKAGQPIFGETFAPFEYVDEHYFVQVDEDQTNVFLYSYSEDGASIAGWHHHYGQGKVCCVTPAHRSEGLLDPTFIRLLRASLSWTATL